MAAADNARRRAQRAAVAAGTWLPRQPAALVAEHVELLIAARMTIQQIADSARVAYSTVVDVRRGLRANVNGATAAAILAVTPAPRSVGHLVPALGTIRRARALAADGFPLTWQGCRAGLAETTVYDVATNAPELVTGHTAERVRALYDGIGGRVAANTPQSSRIRNLAADRGWPGQAAWTAATIDDPDAQPRQLSTPRLGAVA
jgi:hypothetical protein